MILNNITMSGAHGAGPSSQVTIVGWVLALDILCVIVAWNLIHSLQGAQPCRGSGRMELAPDVRGSKCSGTRCWPSS